MYIFKRILIIFKLAHPKVVFFKVIKDVYCVIIPPCNTNSSKKSLNAPDYHDINTHDVRELVTTSVYRQMQLAKSTKSRRRQSQSRTGQLITACSQ